MAGGAVLLSKLRRVQRGIQDAARQRERVVEGGMGLAYKLDRCIYLFFMSGVSVFDSFVFCLYFLGHALRPNDFPDIANPPGITRKVTAGTFSNTFPQASITKLLTGLPTDARFSTIEFVRNLVGHRISGRRSIRSSSTTHVDGTYTMDWHEEAWYLPGADGKTKLTFDDELPQRIWTTSPGC